jgi:tetratricopeptide (TPR) repeat protein
MMKKLTMIIYLLSIICPNMPNTLTWGIITPGANPLKSRQEKPLSFRQVGELIRKVSDSLSANTIKERKLLFPLYPDILDSLKKLGPGPKTLEALESLKSEGQLTLSDVEQLIKNKDIPDSLTAATIQRQKLDSKLDLEVLESLKKLLPGPETLKALSSFVRDPDADAYQSWLNIKDNNTANALERANTYLKNFPNGKYINTVKTWVLNIRRSKFEEAIKSKKTDEVIRIGKEALADDPENLDYLLSLALYFHENETISTQRGDSSHAGEVVDFSQRAIKLIDVGKKPSGVEASKWNQKKALSRLYQNLGKVAIDNNNMEIALDHYIKASTLDPSDPYNFLMCGWLHERRIEILSERLAKLEAEKGNESPEYQAAFNEGNEELERIRSCWRKYMELRKDEGEAAGIRVQNWAERDKDHPGFSRWYPLVCASDTILQNIAYVKYVLHPSYSTPIMDGNKMDKNFIGYGYGYAPFGIIVRIGFKDPRLPILIKEHTLDFTRKQSQTCR